MINALKLPRISITEKDFEDREKVLKDLALAKTILTFYETEKSEYKFLFTGLGESEFMLALMEIHRHNGIFDFFNLTMNTINEFRKNWENPNGVIIPAVEYIKLKNKNQ